MRPATFRQRCRPSLVAAKAGTRPLRLGARSWIRAFAAMGGKGALALLALVLVVGSAQPAAADFRLCNNTSSRVGVAIGYKDAEGWTTEGWWNLPARTCETVLKGNLVARYYYVYAIDYDRGGEWIGQAYMCTRDKEFTIRGIGDCLARGSDLTARLSVSPSRHLLLPGTRLRLHPVFRGRYRPPAGLDGGAHRIGRAAEAG